MLVEGKDVVKIRMDVASAKSAGNIMELSLKHVVSDKAELIAVQQTVIDNINVAYKQIGAEKLKNG